MIVAVSRSPGRSWLISTRSPSRMIETLRSLTSCTVYFLMPSAPRTMIVLPLTFRTSAFLTSVTTTGDIVVLVETSADPFIPGLRSARPISFPSMFSLKSDGSVTSRIPRSVLTTTLFPSTEMTSKSRFSVVVDDDAWASIAPATRTPQRASAIALGARTIVFPPSFMLTVCPRRRPENRDFGAWKNARADSSGRLDLDRLDDVPARRGALVIEGVARHEADLARGRVVEDPGVLRADESQVIHHETKRAGPG